MYLKQIHKILGLIMLVPLLLWAITGFIFLTKPGYENAYEQLKPKFYPIKHNISFDSSAWSEIKLYRTIIGQHLLVNENGVSRHLDLTNLHELPLPSSEQLKLLVSDAISDKTARYGNIIRVDGQNVFTDTGVKITLNWPKLSLRQEGKDTRLINTLYKIHYLQWLSSPFADKILGFSGLVLLIFLALMGLRLLLIRKNN